MRKQLCGLSLILLTTSLLVTSQASALTNVKNTLFTSTQKQVEPFSNFFDKNLPRSSQARNLRQRQAFSGQNLFNFWKNLFNKKPPREGHPGTSRGDFCAISPLDSSPQEPPVKIWSLQPLFVWKSVTLPIGRIEVRDLKSNKLLFFKDVKASDRNVLYQGEALQPGNVYKFVILKSEDEGILWIPFQIMPNPEREQVAIGLKTLEAELNTKKASSETI
ncbi:MAG TPA: hypothetical protein V6D12_05055, partial [Candidatus Obscuribacterales bacterium]